MSKTLTLKRLGKLNHGLTEAVLRACHEWGYCSLHQLSRLLCEYKPRILRHVAPLLEYGYVQDLGNMCVNRESPLKGRWFAPTRKPPEPFLAVPTRRLDLLRNDALDTRYGPSDFRSSKEYIIPRHFAYTSACMAWVTDVLAFFMGINRFVVESEQIIRTTAGLNNLVNSAQLDALRRLSFALNSHLHAIPDARISVLAYNVVFRVEVECSVKNCAGYARLADIYRSQAVPILYVYTSADVLNRVSQRLRASHLIEHIMLGDIQALVSFYWKIGILAPYMPNGIVDEDTIYPGTAPSISCPGFGVTPLR